MKSFPKFAPKFAWLAAVAALLVSPEAMALSRKAAVAPEDMDGALAISAEIKRFNAELGEVLTELHGKGLASQ